MSIKQLKKLQRGIGLIEILIAVVVTSVGFLAAARMQVEGMRFSQSAYYQSQAYFLANDMIDRMRANIPGVLEGAYAGKSTTSSPAPAACTNCTPAEIADLDLYEWSINLHGTPGSGGVVPALQGGAAAAAGVITAVDITDAAAHYSIEMTWSESISGTDTPQNLLIDFELETRGL